MLTLTEIFKAIIKGNIIHDNGCERRERILSGEVGVEDLSLKMILNTGAGFTKGLTTRFRLKFKSSVLNFVNRMLSLWS